MQLGDQPPQRVFAGTLGQRPALQVLPHIDVVDVLPSPHPEGVQATMRSSTKARI